MKSFEKHEVDKVVSTYVYHVNEFLLLSATILLQQRYVSEYRTISENLHEIDIQRERVWDSQVLVTIFHFLPFSSIFIHRMSPSSSNIIPLASSSSACIPLIYHFSLSLSLFTFNIFHSRYICTFPKSLIAFNRQIYGFPQWPWPLASVLSSTRCLRDRVPTRSFVNR